eukprot:12915035-Prorocentrum_lima.AAC.1
MTFTSRAWKAEILLLSRTLLRRTKRRDGLARGTRPGSSTDLCFYASVNGSLLVGASPPGLWLPVYE